MTAVGVVTMLAFAVNFGLSLPVALDLPTHDTYRVVPLHIVGFCVLLGIAAAWLVIAASKLIRHRA